MAQQSLFPASHTRSRTSSIASTTSIHPSDDKEGSFSNTVRGPSQNLNEFTSGAIPFQGFPNASDQQSQAAGLTSRRTTSRRNPEPEELAHSSATDLDLTINPGIPSNHGLDSIRWPNEHAFYNWYTIVTANQRTKFYHVLQVTQTATSKEHTAHVSLQDKYKKLKQTHEKMIARSNRVIKESNDKISRLIQENNLLTEDIANHHEGTLPGTNIRSLNQERQPREGTITSQRTLPYQGSRKMLTGDVDKLISTDIHAFVNFKDNMIFKLEVEEDFFQGNQKLIIRHIYSRLADSIAATMQEKIDKMQDSISIGLALSVATLTFTSLEQLLETLRKAEYRRQEIKSTNIRSDKRINNSNNPKRDRTKPAYNQEPT
ncbi:hypothetical protein SLS57_012523 [Botryosphaeria dothidea]